MCGIAGILDLKQRPVARRDLVRMTDAIAHRGPDGEGHHTDGPLGLGHRRLAVLDLSAAGRQPMASESGRYVLTYNGEIYNFADLRLELQTLGHRFNSQTDTEVLLCAFEEWGESCIERLNGMFAFAIWDMKERSLLLVRDRYGIKPLYYHHDGNAFVFASEVKALLTHPDISTRVCSEALSEYFTFQNIFTDLTLFDGVRLLPAGCTMRIDAKGRAPVQRRYWDYRFDSSGFDMSAEDATAQVRYLFEQAVTRQLVADVPVGSYLSGGIDSGAITAVASRHIPRLHTFTGGFDLSSASGMELGFDERAAAEVMANLFKTEHYEMVMHAGDMEYVLPELIRHLEDLRVGQCYPNYYVARLASKFVTVVLGGAGGDELFAGYPWRYYRGFSNGGADFESAYYDYWQRLIPDSDRSRFFNGDHFATIAGHEPRDLFSDALGATRPARGNLEELVNTSLAFETRTFLHGLLIVEDKLSMAHSLEARVPFLDNDLVDFALRIPPRMKLRDLEHAPAVDEDEPGKTTRYRQQPTPDGKIILRDAVRPYVPDSVAERAKQGFSAPDASWFRGESIDYVNRLLRAKRAGIYDYLSRDYVTETLDEHTSGKANHRLLIWSLLSFEWWLKEFVE
ncbi:MAG: asparagine synthase (glutamine-hydrolyzing) [Planctomycetota bacterium]|jgi:asparagine synthase (glutamine-hydrolysing)